MGKPSEQTRCDDWTAAYILDEAALSFGGWVTDEVKRYASHVPASDDSKKKRKPPTLENIMEYQRALVEGTMFNRIVRTRRLPSGRKEEDTT